VLNVYLDMDGVLANFDKKWNEIHGSDEFNREAFRDYIMNYKIFEELEPMPELEVFADVIKTYKDKFNFQVLSSLGSPMYFEQREETVKQKNNWLERYSITIPTIYVHHKGLKRRFATPHSILVDDTKQNVYDFDDNNGFGIHYQYGEKNFENDKYSKGLEELMNLLHLYRKAETMSYSKTSVIITSKEAK
jgi:hypothetical protein